MLEVRGVVVRYGETAALDGMDLTVHDAERAVVMGPSGSGKSTLLRVIAGLEVPDRGTIRWNGRSLDDVPPHRRGFGLMFQDYALFPHRNVGRNVAYGLEMQGLGRGEIERRVADTLDLVGLPGAERRDIATLSGGEQQRVALARTLAPRPSLVLLDEPLGSLDRTLRDRLLTDMPAIFDRLGSTVVYVTHDREEAFAIGHRITVVDDGKPVAHGTAADLWRRPPSRFVASFLGLENVFDVTTHDDAVTTGWLTIPVPASLARPVAIAIPPEHVVIDPAGELEGTVVEARFRGGSYLVRIAVAGGTELTADTRDAPPPGTPVRLRIDPEAVALLPR